MKSRIPTAIAMLATLTVAACGASATATPGVTPTPAATATPAATPASLAGTVFQGDGYSILVPSAYAFQHIALSHGDSWFYAPASGASKRFGVESNTLLSSQDLAGALAWAKATLGPVVTGSPEQTAIPAGSAYRLAMGDTGRALVVYQGGRAWLLTLEGLSDAEEQGISASFAIG